MKEHGYKTDNPYRKTILKDSHEDWKTFRKCRIETVQQLRKQGNPL